MNNALQPEIVLDHICKLGEGPVWDAEQKKIWWLDIVQGEIHQFNTITKQHSSFKAGEMIGCIVPREQGGFIAGLENGIGFIDVENNEVMHLINPEEGLNNRCNDGKADAEGRFWVGTMSKTEEENMGNFYMVDADLSIQKKLEHVSISNGLAWNDDNTILYYINTPTNYIFAFDFDMETGSINNQRVVVDLTHEKGFADGMTIDEEGMLWVAFYDGWRVARYNPVTGDLLQQVDLPVANATCCTFGGENLTDLYITTASKEMSDEALQQQPHAGKLFVVKNTGVKGTPTKKFKA